MATLFDQTNKVYMLLCGPGGQFVIDRRRVCRDVGFRRSKRTLLSSSIGSRIVRGFGIRPERRTERRFEESDKSSLLEEVENCDRPPFDINLAVVLAGFAFEAYNTPSEKSGAHETDPFDCKTTILSEQFLRELYDGQLSIFLKKGFRFPGLDLWGTSDPYVTLCVGEAVVRSKTIWAATEPFWNENFRINVKNLAGQYLQVAAWDANLVTDDRRLGNAGVNLDPLLDGKKHKVELELEGMNGGGVVEIEVQYQTFDKLDADSKGLKLPFISDFLVGQGFEDVLKGFGGLKARDFLSSALGPLQQRSDNEKAEANYGLTETHMQPTSDGSLQKNEAEDERYETTNSNDSDISSEAKNLEMADQRESDLLRKLSESVSHTFGVSVDKLGVRSLNQISWDAIDLMKKLGLEHQKRAEPDYIENGLAIVENKQGDNGMDNGESPAKSIPLTLEVQKASLDLLKQTEDILRSWAVIAGSAARQNGKKEISSKIAVMKESLPSAPETERVAPTIKLEGKLQSAEEMEELRKMFSKAESAMEAWALLATSLGQKSFVKSAFEKICFLDNNKTDTQVAIWRDSQHHRLVVAFRGTEQVKWKDLRTDLMLLPVGFNPERIGGDFKEEPMVHGGFLNAYDSVRHRLMTLLKASVGSSTDEAGADYKWHVYVTGHSLGGALATLFALQLTETQLFRDSRIKVTMYNFGSPRVGNKKFALCYNARVKDSWRVVNHRDIIPTVPRLMGYCHVAQPIYLTAGDLYGATVNRELLEDGYQGDVIGEATPDFLLEEFMKGEKRLIERLFQTEIAMLHALRDGSALMQHMEDFYYITLLENVSPRFRKLKDTDDKTFKS